MRKEILVLLVVVSVGAMVLFAARLFVGGGEDNWICEKQPASAGSSGEARWVKHGKPSSPMPQTGCGEKRETRPGEFANGQKYEIYKADDFEVKYPHWPNIDKKYLLEPEKVELAVADAGCNFVINTVSIPGDTTFKDYIEKSVQEQIVKTKSKTITKDIKDNTAYFVGEVTMGNVTLHSVSYGYMSSKRQLYSIAFVAEKTKFSIVCQPIVDEVVKSVEIK